MKANEGTADRAIRVVLALAAGLGAILAGPTTVLGIVLMVVGAVLLFTAAVGFCPLYRVIGISTRHDKAEPVSH